MARVESGNPNNDEVLPTPVPATKNGFNQLKIGYFLPQAKTIHDDEIMKGDWNGFEDPNNVPAQGKGWLHMGITMIILAIVNLLGAVPVAFSGCKI